MIRVITKSGSATFIGSVKSKCRPACSNVTRVLFLRLSFTALSVIICGREERIGRSICRDIGKICGLFVIFGCFIPLLLNIVSKFVKIASRRIEVLTNSLSFFITARGNNCLN
jgi:hypothetical protein